MSGNRSHVEEWAEFVDAEVPESEKSRDADRRERSWTVE